MQSVIKKWGNSLALRIPASYAKDIGLTNGSEVDISILDKTISVKCAIPVKKVHSLTNLLKGVNGTNIHREINTGDPIGQETW